MIDKVRVNVYLDSELKNRAMEKAKKMGLNFSAFVSLALYEYINKEGLASGADGLTGARRCMVDQPTSRGQDSV